MAPTPPAGTPDQVRTWWAGLGDEERRHYVEDMPAAIGGLDGVPSLARHYANTRLLDAYIERTGDLDAVRLREEFRASGGLLLLFVPPSTVGGTDTRVAISYNDPDHAVATSVLVPGTATNTRSPKYLNHALDFVRRLRDRADSYTDLGDNAAVFWLGYKSPDLLVPDAMSARYARDGHAALTSFLGGLRAANVRGEQRGPTTLIGYSYGSTVVGHAAAAADLTKVVDTVLIAGSPGLGRHIRSVEDLGFTPDRFLVAASPIDPVVRTPSFVHGTNPAHPSFRATLVETGTIGHLGYGTEGTPAFLNAVYIVTGDLDRVTKVPAARAAGTQVARLGDWFGSRVGRRSDPEQATAADAGARPRPPGRGAHRPRGRSGRPRL
ncbi:alpha/beta hydrolase [Marinitenerispora sediminis]|nr:alpha/beta hydrolase [Marinitenerispora sediminis]